MLINIDGECFYDTTLDCEVIPHAVDFVCPGPGVPYSLTGSGDS